MTDRAESKIHNSRLSVTGGRFTHCPKCGAKIDGAPRYVHCGPMSQTDARRGGIENVDDDRADEESEAEGQARRPKDHPSNTTNQIKRKLCY